MLYNIFKMGMEGSKQALPQCVTFPSYVQAVIVLVRHMLISRMRRIGHAFSGLHDQSLFFHGDVLRFQSGFLAVKRELDTTRASVAHLAICQLMKAFDGKSKTVPFKIADGFIKIDLDVPNINPCGLVQGYCAGLATVAGIWKFRLELFGARIGTLEFQVPILLRKLSFWVPESADSDKSVDPESEL